MESGANETSRGGSGQLFQLGMCLCGSGSTRRVCWVKVQTRGWFGNERVQCERGRLEDREVSEDPSGGAGELGGRGWVSPPITGLLV